MKTTLIILLSFTASALLVPTGSADPCESRPGHQRCDVSANTDPAGCGGGYTYYHHDAFFVFDVNCHVGPKSIGTTFPFP